MNRIAFCVFGALVVFAVYGFAADDLPTISQATFQERVLAFNRRTLTEAYKQVGVRHPKWDNLVVQYLDSYAQFFTDPRKAPTAGSLLATGKQIIGLGCTDPLVLYCHGVAQVYCNDCAAAEQSLSAAATQLAKSKYPAIRQRFAASRMAYVCRNYGFKRQAEYEGWRTQAIALLVKSLQDRSYRADEQRIFMLHFESDWNDLFLDKRGDVYQVIRAVDKIDPWILNVVEGDYWIAEAWKARGSGWAKTVTEAGWKGFYASLAKARTNLTTAWEMHPDYPEAATRMIQVARDTGATGLHTGLQGVHGAVVAPLGWISRGHAQFRVGMPRHPPIRHGYSLAILRDGLSDRERSRQSRYGALQRSCRLQQFADDVRVGLGGYYWYPGAVLRFRNLQICSLQDVSR
jgi:Domain of unknown function (DUF4034)